MGTERAPPELARRRARRGLLALAPHQLSRWTRRGKSRITSTRNQAGSAPSSSSAITSCAISRLIRARSLSAALARWARFRASSPCRSRSCGSSRCSRARNELARKYRRSRSDGASGQRARPPMIESSRNRFRTCFRKPLNWIACPGERTVDQGVHGVLGGVVAVAVQRVRQHVPGARRGERLLVLRRRAREVIGPQPDVVQDPRVDPGPARPLEPVPVVRAEVDVDHPVHERARERLDDRGCPAARFPAPITTEPAAARTRRSAARG